MESIRLRSVRPFLFEELSLISYSEADEGAVDLTTKVKVNKFLKSKVRFTSPRAFA